MNALPRSRQHARHPHLRLIRGHQAVVGGSGAKVVPLFPADAPSTDVGPWAGGGDEPCVVRRDLFERLGRAARVTIVSAPAGSGKTWLLRSWIADAGLGRRTAWTTVAHEERDGQRFCASLVDALDGVAGGDAGRINGEPRSEALIERLLRALQQIQGPAVLVIDDLHELQADDALAALEHFLAEVLDRQPPEVRDLLVRTAVLERVNGPLADALTGRTRSLGLLAPA